MEGNLYNNISRYRTLVTKPVLIMSWAKNPSAVEREVSVQRVRKIEPVNLHDPRPFEYTRSKMVNIIENPAADVTICGTELLKGPGMMGAASAKDIEIYIQGKKWKFRQPNT